ncbi:hypothetical protein HJFPF1_09740 [Paramyrothecium foliicola]|nr:hypothetical protein HJFPF1_09740 [Paramyrothecium foliicola]
MEFGFTSSLSQRRFRSHNRRGIDSGQGIQACGEPEAIDPCQHRSGVIQGIERPVVATESAGLVVTVSM